MLKASHLFNLLDARGVISVTERQPISAASATLAKACAEAWVASRGHEARPAPMAELLLELLSEEIPARMQARAARDLEGAWSRERLEAPGSRSRHDAPSRRRAG